MQINQVVNIVDPALPYFNVLPIASVSQVMHKAEQPMNLVTYFHNYVT
jgi:hypothetical protein